MMCKGITFFLNTQMFATVLQDMFRNFVGENKT